MPTIRFRASSTDLVSTAATPQFASCSGMLNAIRLLRPSLTSPSHRDRLDHCDHCDQRSCPRHKISIPILTSSATRHVMSNEAPVNNGVHVAAVTSAAAAAPTTPMSSLQPSATGLESSASATLAERYQASFLLAACGDAMGFRDGEWGESTRHTRTSGHEHELARPELTSCDVLLRRVQSSTIPVLTSTPRCFR
jgi:hypothetical protein